MLFALAMLACKGTVAPVSSVTPSEQPSPEIRKSPLDQRTYREVQLENGLRAVVVHDEDVDMAAAALSVHVGHLGDPENREGLAHFLEHMLFMGTDEFPDVEEYRRFVQDNGGSTNAGTGTESTTYFFKIKEEKLAPAIDRFSRFFIAPVLDKTFVERERNAVNNEYSYKIKDDVRRIREVKKKTRNPAHPYHKFSVGNLDTLGDREGEDLHADLRALYAEHYVADNMTLSIIGRQSLDELEALVRSEFKEVPARVEPENNDRPAPYLPSQIGVELRIVPLKDVKRLEIIVPMPSSNLHPEERPIDVLAYLLGDESEGWLFDTLKAKGWVDALSTSEDGTDDFSQLEIRIELTDAGYEAREDVADVVFQAVELLKNADLKPHFDQMGKLGTLNFAFSEESSPDRAVRSLVRMMPYVPTANLLDFRYRFDRFDASLLREHLDLITPANTRLVVVAQDVETDQVEPLYDTPFAILPLTEAQQAALTDGSVQVDLSLPPLNPWIADDTTLEEASDAKAPVQLDSGVPGLAVWHLPDVSYGVPRAYTSIELALPGLRSHEDRVANALFVRLIDDSLTSFKSPLVQAGLRVRLGTHPHGLDLTLTGYDQKQPEVLQALVERIQAFTIDPERFDLVKENLRRDLANAKKARPINQTFRAFRTALDPVDSWTEDDLRALAQLDQAAIEARFSGGLKGSTGRMLVHGNMAERDVVAMANTLAPWMAEGKLGTSKWAKIPAGTAHIDLPVDHADSTIVVAFQGAENDVETRARYALMGALLRTDFFTELRTKQQLGYVVFASSQTNLELPSLTFGIQSSSTGPGTLEERIRVFLEERPKVLMEMPDEALANVKQGLVARLLESETRLYNRSSRLADELDRGLTGFDDRERMAAAVRVIDKAALSKMLQVEILGENARSLVVRSQGTDHDPVSGATCKVPDCGVLNRWALQERER